MIAVRNENSRYIYIPMDDTGSTEQKGVWLVVVVGVVPLFFLGYCTYIGRPFLHSSDCFHILKFDRELFCAVGRVTPSNRIHVLYNSIDRSI